MRAGQLLAWGLSFAIAASASGQLGCDEKPPSTKKEKAVDAGGATPTPTVAAPQPPAKPPPITVEPGAFAVGPERIMANDPDPIARLVALLTSRPDVADAVVDFEARRATKPSQVVTLLAALKKAKAKGATVHTETREKTMGALEVTFLAAPPSDCTAVALIGRDGAILVWPAGGGTAKRYSRGFAGPDMTLGTEGVREVASRCESPVLLVGADDAMNWGLVYDLAAISKSSGSLKPTQVAIVPGTTVGGRKVIFE